LFLLDGKIDAGMKNTEEPICSREQVSPFILLFHEDDYYLCGISISDAAGFPMLEAGG
jgi:hypothetical protein